jgi:hypothetical protein
MHSSSRPPSRVKSESLYIATTGTTIVERADTLAQLRDKLQAIFCAVEGEDIACWRIASDGRARLALIVCADGRLLSLDGYSLSWTFPPPKDAAESTCLLSHGFPARLDNKS